MPNKINGSRNSNLYAIQKKKKKNDVHNGVSQKECPKIDNL